MSSTTLHLYQFQRKSMDKQTNRQKRNMTDCPIVAEVAYGKPAPQYDDNRSFQSQDYSLITGYFNQCES